MFSAQRSLDLVESKMSLNCGGSLLGARYDTGLELVLLHGARYGTVIYLGGSLGARYSTRVILEFLLRIVRYWSGTITSFKSIMALEWYWYFS